MITNYMYQGKFTDTFTFIEDYINLVNKYYSLWSIPSINGTYYNLDIENSKIDRDKLVNGSYELVGDLSGYMWRKVLNFEFDGVEPISTTTPTADERGVTYSEKMTTALTPIGQGIVPQVHDFFCFTNLNTGDNYILRNPPLYEVVNVERSNDTDYMHYKVSMKISYVTVSQIENQISELMQYVDYEKKIYEIDQAIILQKIMWQKDNLLINKTYDQNCGLYLDNVPC